MVYFFVYTGTACKFRAHFLALVKYTSSVHPYTKIILTVHREMNLKIDPHILFNESLRLLIARYNEKTEMMF